MRLTTCATFGKASMRIEASQRLLSQMSNQEKITHYTKMLGRIKHRLRNLDPETAPLTTRRYLKRAIRLEMRVQELKSRHRH